MELFDILVRWRTYSLVLPGLGMLYYFNFVKGHYFQQARPWLRPKPNSPSRPYGGFAEGLCLPLPVLYCWAR